MAWIAVAGLAVSAYSANASRKNAKKALKGADAATQLQREQYDQMLERYKKHYAPVEKRLSHELSQGADLRGEGDRARGEFTEAYDQSLDESRRQMRRQGIDPTSMQAARFEEDTAYNRAAGAAREGNRARTEEDDRYFARQLSFMSGGANLQSQSAQGYGNIAGRQYGLAAEHASDSAAALSTAGEIVGYGLKKNRTGKQDTPKIPSVPKPTGTAPALQPKYGAGGPS